MSLVDYLIVSGDNSREILENGWRQNNKPILIFSCMILFLALYSYGYFYDFYDVIGSAFKNPWFLLHISYILLVVFLGYHYPVDRNIWSLVTLSVLIMSIVFVHAVVH